MTAHARRSLRIVAFVIAIGTATGTYAQTVRLRPTPLIPPPVPSVPTLGYTYQVVPGYGFQVTSVVWGSPAARLGLEAGDMVLSINGVRMTYLGADVPVRAHAARQSGWVNLAIRDVRTGVVQFRSTNLFESYGVIGRPIGSGIPYR